MVKRKDIATTNEIAEGIQLIEQLSSNKKMRSCNTEEITGMEIITTDTSQINSEIETEMGTNSTITGTELGLTRKQIRNKRSKQNLKRKKNLEKEQICEMEESEPDNKE